MYRVIAIVGAGLALAACSSSSDFFSSMKPGPTLETVRFESEPPGAEAKTASGQACRTPCALAIQQPESGAKVSVTYTLNGYQTAVTELELVSQGDGTSKLQPNPALIELTAAPPPKKPARKPAAKPKPKAAPKPAAAAPAPAPAPAMAPAPAPQQAPSPWPAPTQPAR